MKLIFLGYCFLALESFGQIQGQVVDAESGEPIPFATVRWEIGSGDYTNREGEFELPSDVIAEVIVSCVGYKADTVGVVSKEFLKIKLSPDMTELIPLTISDKPIKPIRLGVEKKAKRMSAFAGNEGFQVAIFIPNGETGKELLIKKAFYHLRGGMSGSKVTKPKNSFFRVRIYEPDLNGKPGADLLNKNLIVYPERNKGWAEVDLSDYWILVPKNGLFVAIEWIEGTPTAEYKSTNQNGKKNIREDFGSPIKLHLSENKNLSLWYKSTPLGWFNWNEMTRDSDFEHKEAVPGIHLEVIQL